MEILVMRSIHWLTIEKPLSIRKKISKLQKKSVIGLEKEEPMEISVMLTIHWVTIKKPLSFMRNV